MTELAAVAGRSVLPRPRWLDALPARAWAWWAVVALPAAAAVVVSLTRLDHGGWGRFAAVAAAASAAQLAAVGMSGRRVFHPAIVFVVAGALVLDPEQLALMCVVQHVPDWLKHRYAWYIQTFNIGNYVLAALSAWAVADAVSGAGAAPAGIAAATCFVAVNRLLLAPMLRLGRGLKLRETRLLALDDLSLELVLALMAVPAVALWRHDPVLAALSFAPLVLIQFTQRTSERLERASETIVRQNASLEEAHRTVVQRSTASLEALSATVDARDKYTAGHSKRVAAISTLLARELGLEGAELETVSQAALLHDIGKIGVPDAVLLKEGELTHADWLAMRSHAEEGARIIERLGFLDDVVPAIRHHHERPDGRGYPDGLIGDEIPLAARVIHVADALDAMTTERVYRGALSVDAAIGEIRAGRGTDFCACCVDALERALAAGALDGLLPRKRAAA
ncbi:MAG TPA: HD-GYP domain-containing protein [Gaiellaceae bacterium]|nr:HD-GYP domain-containing protein [Gaiellaceae bacterium]